MLYANSDNITSFLICMRLISLSFFIILAIDSTVMLNKNNDSGQPYLTLGLRGKALSLSPLSMTVVVVFL